MKNIPKGRGGEYYTWYILPKVPKGQGMNTMPDRSCRKFPPKNYNQGLPDISCQRSSPEKYPQGPRDEYLIYPTKGPLLKSIPKGQGINTRYILTEVHFWRVSPRAKGLIPDISFQRSPPEGDPLKSMKACLQLSPL